MSTIPIIVDVPITINGTTIHLTGTGSVDIGSGGGTPPPTLTASYVYAGQSNMLNTVPFFAAQGQAMHGFAEGAQPISYWDVGTNGWVQTLAQISGHMECRAFIWFQGETDDINITSGQPGAISPTVYTTKLVDLISRVRTAVGNAALPIFITQINTQYTHINPALVSAVTQIPGSRLIQTADLEWAGDNIHLDNTGATAYANRIIALG